ncbi:MAG: hypothetical protein ACF8PG_10785, partial [Maioricimonas sp. JB045]
MEMAIRVHRLLLERFMRHFRASFVCLLLLIFAGGLPPAEAQDIDNAPGQIVLDDISGSMALSNDGGSYL